MIGCGSMGGGMALLFAEDGVHVNLSDPSEKAMDGVIEKAEQAGYTGKLKKHSGRRIPITSLFRPLTI
jgi:6-phosphogluconate dehydrogenase